MTTSPWSPGRAIGLLAAIGVLEAAARQVELPAGAAVFYLWTVLVRLVDLALLGAACARWGSGGVTWADRGTGAGLRWGLGAAAVCTLSALAVEAVARSRGGSLIAAFLRPDPALASPGPLAAAAAAMVLAGPVAEEAVFRGVLLGVMLPRLGRWISVVGSALAFAGLHHAWGASWLDTVPPLAGGLAFGTLASGRGGLRAAVVLHAAGNAAVLWVISRPS